MSKEKPHPILGYSRKPKAVTPEVTEEVITSDDIKQQRSFMGRIFDYFKK